MAGFGPYFALEGFGISLPYIGFANIDPTYSLDGLTQMLLFFLASFVVLVCYMEFKDMVGNELFTYYHYPVSAAALYWQLSGNVTLLGIAWFSAIHMFTLWGTLVLLMPKALPTLMV